jgi:hypothetical protein
MSIALNNLIRHADLSFMRDFCEITGAIPTYEGFALTDLKKRDKPEKIWAMFDLLKEQRPETLKLLGLKVWDHDDKKRLWQFPMEWYMFIPDGYPIVDLRYKPLKFIPQSTSLETFDGMLKYGIKQEITETTKDNLIRKTITIETQVDITLDPSRFDKEFNITFNKHFYAAETLDDHFKHIAFAIAVGHQDSEDSYIEGYGTIEEIGCEIHNVDNEVTDIDPEDPDEADYDLDESNDNLYIMEE